MTRGRPGRVPSNAGRDQSRGEPGQRALHHARKDVVGSSREREQRYVAATLGHDAVRAIAAKGNDRGRAKIAQSLRGFGRVAGMAHDWHRKWREGQARCGRGRCPLDDAVGVREIRDLADPGGVETKQHAPDDIDLLVIVERGAVGDETPNILARRRVRDDSDQRPLRHGRGIDASQRLTIAANAGAASTCGTWPTPSMISSQAVGRAVSGRDRVRRRDHPVELAPDDEHVELRARRGDRVRTRF